MRRWVPRPLALTAGRWSSSSASSKLFADAKAEEQNVPTKQPQVTNPPEHENWTGEERMQDAVLRMLVDKYKPLRSGSIQSADDKLKRMAMSPRGTLTPAPVVPGPLPEVAISTEPPLSPDEHKPWLVTFQVPSHATITPSVKFGRIPPSPRPLSPSSASSSTLDLDPRARAQLRKQKKLEAGPGRLTKARESTLDYRLGGSLAAVEHTRTAVRSPATEEADGDQSHAGWRRANPTSLRAWSSLIEDKIERARAKGQFDNLSGRGKPLARDPSESNPFIAREEFLMNRIVKRNGAAPPWVETQQEMDNALTNFRQTLISAWTRRVIRTLTIDRPPSSLTRIPISQIASIRDPEWESREYGYHTHLINELNSVIRKYNNQAPYAVRKPYVTLSAELAACYDLAAPRVLEELRGKANEVAGGSIPYHVPSPAQAGSGGAGGRMLESQGFGMGEVVRKWLRRVAW